MVPHPGIKRESGAGSYDPNSGAAPATVIGERFANEFANFCHWSWTGKAGEAR